MKSERERERMEREKERERECVCVSQHAADEGSETHRTQEADVVEADEGRAILSSPFHSNG